ncbi:MAG: hypothetical protein N4A63_17900 [Vallitalea sp.]|jgi:flagellar biosynthesis/type III secretory pathway M-ring protein FliF/YscJ|nr:hypothetical protein [Vallitalea sp.]
MDRNYRNIIMLIAGIIVSIIGFINKYDIKTFTFTLIIVLVIFYILGSIIQNMIHKIYVEVKNKTREKQLIEMKEMLAQKEKEKEEADNQEELDEQEEQEIEQQEEDTNESE